jgi:hypothetical protein
MKKEHEIIMEELSKYLDAYPQLRFCQALFNLDIIGFPENPNIPDLRVVRQPARLRDTFYDEDIDVLNRLDKRLKELKKV